MVEKTEKGSAKPILLWAREKHSESDSNFSMRDVVEALYPLEDEIDSLEKHYERKRINEKLAQALRRMTEWYWLRRDRIRGKWVYYLTDQGRELADQWKQEDDSKKFLPKS